MNAPNPNPGERDLEALRRAQRAHEPSMEEILASIRSIIADDRESAVVKPTAAPSGPQIVYSKDEFAPVRATEPTPPKVVWSAPQPEAVAPPSPPRHEAAAPTNPPRQEAVTAPSPPRQDATPPPSAPALEPAQAAPAAEGGPLLSTQADEAVSSAFEALSASLALQSSEMAESMTREILRPMLKAWLDENLPSLVERLVRAEIQRVARGGR